jgi:hypothetical protein
MPHPASSIEGGDCRDVPAARAAMRCRGYIGARSWLTEANATVTGAPRASAEPRLSTLRLFRGQPSSAPLPVRSIKVFPGAPGGSNFATLFA